ncbi:9323_t:CDS:2 [Funneliformis mosseae]|uniref:9323_t:CDS:1 n=1 Tax=Funneliformis mosseae TaxID=27381 RepID=A0A9N8WAT2_FUNMO|nr:9323_t:CDS:2 [Funneliformis mosseae]
MVLKNNLEKNLRDLETRIKELEQSNERICSQFNHLEEKVREREEETKTKEEIIVYLEEKVSMNTRTSFP